MSTTTIGYRATLTKDSTPQEVFDHIKKACKAGSFPSIDHDNGRCNYRSKDRACAFGIFIPDDKYLPEYERHNAAQVIGAQLSSCYDNFIRNPLDRNDFPAFFLEERPRIDNSNISSKYFIDLLQEAHDSIAMKTWNDELFISKLRDVFHYYGHQVN